MVLSIIFLKVTLNKSLSVPIKNIVVQLTTYLKYFFVYFLFSISSSTIFFVLWINFIKGLPFFSFKIIISLKFIPFEIPVPNALENASFAANLLAKQFNIFFVFLHFFISSVLNNLSKKFFFF